MLTTFQVAICLSLAGALWWIYERGNKHFQFDIATATKILVFSLVATLVQSTAAHLLIEASGWNEPGWSFLELWLMRVMFFWLVYIAWSLLLFGLMAERMVERSDHQARVAREDAERFELQLLRSQLDPHFLFNALNGISSASAAQAPSAAAMARELADYLRYSLDHRHDTKVPLRIELEAMAAYLRIEEARFGNELHVQVDVGAGSEAIELPCFLLLPLVENSVKHALRTSKPPWNILIRTATHHSALSIEIQNSGSLKSGTGSEGLGLKILRRRLEIHYPRRHRLDLWEEQGLVHAKLELEGRPCSA